MEEDAKLKADRDFYKQQAEDTHRALSNLLSQLERHGYELEHAALEVMPWYVEAKDLERSILRATINHEISNRRLTRQVGHFINYQWVWTDAPVQ